MGRHETYMRIALTEAAKATGKTRPNPMVGCVVVRNGEVVAKGYHERAGKAHAEQVALRRAGARAEGADVYVTLEPCNHHGRTPPCTDALIEAKVARVFVGMRDPNGLVDGRGIRRLRRAGIDVQMGVLRDECTHLNEAFVHYIRENTPFVIAKLAQSIDGRVATKTGHSKWITGEKARKFGHQIRRAVDGIVVGVGTVLADDPELTCRVRGGSDPIRTILDSKARTPVDAKVIRIAESSKAPTWVVVGEKVTKKKVEALQRAGAEVIRMPLVAGRVELEVLMAELGKRELLSILVEGGPTLMGSFFDAGLVHKVHALVAPMVIGGEQARSSVEGAGIDELKEACRLQRLELDQLGPDVLLTGYTR